MTQPQQSLADAALDELSQQLSFTMRALAISQARVKQLEVFIRANAEALGLQEISAEEADQLDAPSDVEPEAQPQANGKAQRVPATAKRIK